MIKNILSLLILLVFTLSIESCRDETIWMNDAEITGYDYRECACCGGYFIDIADETYRFYEIPEGSSLEINTETIFPISVQVNWHEMENACMGDEIILDDVE